MKTNKRLD